MAAVAAGSAEAEHGARGVVGVAEPVQHVASADASKHAGDGAAGARSKRVRARKPKTEELYDESLGALLARIPLCVEAAVDTGMDADLAAVLCKKLKVATAAFAEGKPEVALTQALSVANACEIWSG